MPFEMGFGNQFAVPKSSTRRVACGSMLLKKVFRRTDFFRGTGAVVRK
jgi:hypothetical protein